MANMIKFDIDNILSRINNTEMPIAKGKVVAKATTPKAKVKAVVQKTTAKETNEKAEKPKRAHKDDSVVRSLSTLPAMDCNYTSALNKATKEQIEEAIKVMESNGGRNKTRIKRCKEKLAEFRGKELSKKYSKKTETEVEVEQPKKKAIIVQFPTKKPEFETLEPTHEGHSYEECEAKLNKEREIFKDADSKFVIDGLLEKCKEDADFCDNVMREDKTYAGAFEYFFNLAKQGFAIKVNDNMAYLDNEMALEYAINYFNKK